MNYLWNIAKEAEEDERMHQNYNYRKGGKPYNDKYKNQKQRFNRGKRERSRSDSRNRDERNQKYENYETKEIKNMKIIKCNRKDIILLKDTCNLR